MKSVRWVDIVFFLGFAGIMYAVLYGSWRVDSPYFAKTLAAFIFGTIFVVGSFWYMYKRKKERGDVDSG